MADKGITVPQRAAARNITLKKGDDEHVYEIKPGFKSLIDSLDEIDEAYDLWLNEHPNDLSGRVEKLGEKLDLCVMGKTKSQPAASELLREAYEAEDLTYGQIATFVREITGLVYLS